MIGADLLDFRYHVGFVGVISVVFNRSCVPMYVT